MHVCFISSLLFAVLAAGMATGSSAAEVPTFSNPIGEGAAADPFVTYDAALDWYYCLHTEGTAVRIRRSRRPERLLSDNDVKTVFETNAVAGVYRHLWAPEMHRAPNGKWYVYTSGDTTPGREWTLRLVCLESETSDPFDGFHFKSFPLPGVQAIDPTVHWTPDGRGYLACARMGGGGEHLAIYELANPWTCRGAGVEIARPTLPWEKKAGRILEGPFFVKGAGDGLFIVYSANDTRSEHYALGALAFDGGDIMSAASWHKRKEPVLFKANGVYGPGHASFFRTRGGELWCAYHGMDSGDGADGPTARPRKMHLQPADPDDDGCPHLAGAWGRGPHRVPDAPKETLPPLPAGAFSYVVIPDTQRYRGAGSWSGSSQPTSNPAFESRVNWIVRHAKDQNIAFVSHVGDITDRNNDPQYQFASNLMSRLDGVVPWRTAAGNHDMVPKTGDTTNFERWFGSPNRVDLFEAGGMKFVVVTLVCNAPEPVMRWADEQLEKYADRLAIVCTHAYLGPRDPSDRWQYACREPSTRHYELRIPDERLGRMPWLSAFGEYSTTNGVGNTGETMWRNHLSKHKNLFLVVCGDQSAVVSQHLVDTGANGNVVHAFLQDYPRDNDRTDPVRVFRFLPAERRVEVFTVMAGEDVLCTRAKFLEEHHRFTFDFAGPAVPETHPDRPLRCGDRAPGAVRRFPSGSFYHEGRGGCVLDVTKPPFNAKGDGVHDDTEALSAAMRFIRDNLRVAADERTGGTACCQRRTKNWLVYLPNGTYRVSDTVSQGWPALALNLQFGWDQVRYVQVQTPKEEEALRECDKKAPKGTCETVYAEANWQVRVCGESREGVTIRLDDGAAGFSGAEGKPVLAFWLLKQGSNVNLGNYLENVTVDTGRGNPGAIGVAWACSNFGGIRNVRICSPDRKGAVGVDMVPRNSCSYFRDVTVEGFRTGFAVNSGLETVVTVEHATVADAETGFEAGQHPRPGDRSGNVLNLRKVDFRNVKEPLLSGEQGVVAAVDCPRLPATRPALVDVRDVPLSLPAPPDDCATPEQFGARGDGLHDDTEAFRRALAAGRRAVVCTRPIYLVEGTLDVPGSVEQIDFLHAHVIRHTADNTNAILRVGERGGGPLCVRCAYTIGAVFVDHAADRELVLEDIYCDFHHTRHWQMREGFMVPRAPQSPRSWYVYRNATPAVRKTVHAVSCTQFCGGCAQSGPDALVNVDLRARLVNSEHFPEAALAFRDSTVWIFGLKSEDQDTFLDFANSTVDIAGASFLQWRRVDDTPVVRVRDSRYALDLYVWAPQRIALCETRGGRSSTVLTKDAPRSVRRGGLVLHLTDRHELQEGGN